MKPSRLNPRCLHDPLSVCGLRRLARSRGDWATLLARPAARLSPRDARHATLGDYLRFGAVHQFFPSPGRGVEAVYRARGSGRRLAATIGGKLMETIGPKTVASVLAHLRSGETRKGRALSRAVARRDIRFMADVVNAWRCGAGLPAIQIEKRSFRRLRPSGRHTVALSVAASLIHIATPIERIALALSLGCGLRETEIVRAEVEDIFERRRRVEETDGRIVDAVVAYVRVRGADGRAARIVPVPRWVLDIVEAGGVWPQYVDPGLPLVPTADGSRRTELRPLLRKIRRRAGAAGRKVTFGALRTTWQALATSARVPRRMVRGTSTAGPGLGPAGSVCVAPWSEAERLARLWDRLDAPVSAPIQEESAFPRRARHKRKAASARSFANPPPPASATMRSRTDAGSGPRTGKRGAAPKTPKKPSLRR